MSRSVKALAALVCFILIFSMSACGKEQDSHGKSSSSTTSTTTNTADTEKPDGFKLAVTLTKSLNPLTTDSMTNLVLWPLMYDTLADTSQSYAPVLNLAAAVNNNGQTVTVQLKPNVKFTDGSVLTAKDVIYSYKQVMNTKSSYFYSYVKNISDIGQGDSSTVIFYLDTPDPLFSNLLKVPIIKYQSDQANQSFTVKGINVPPIGTGMYTFSSDSFSGTLNYNKNWYKATEPQFKTIRLVNFLNSNDTFPSLKIGGINFLLTDYGNGALSASGLATTPVDLNRLVFVGINSAHSTLADAKVRHAISLAIDRASIVTNAFSSRAAATYLPFNPSWAAVAKPDAAQLSSDNDKATNELTQAGYSVLGTGGARTGSKDGVSVSLSYKLLVNNSDNVMMLTAKELATDLNKIGIVLNIDAQAPDQYNTMIAQGNFDLYLGQMGLGENMDITPLLSRSNPAASGVGQSSATLSAFNAWRSATADIQSVVSAFTGETPFVPICYRYGAVSYTKSLQGNFAPKLSNIFQGVESWHY